MADSKPETAIRQQIVVSFNCFLLTIVLLDYNTFKNTPAIDKLQK
jgi:hypothetical protein